MRSLRLTLEYDGTDFRGWARQPTLRTVEGEIELRVSDDGTGFNAGETPLGPDEPGHIGLATMRERAELIGGRLEIRTGPKGSTVLVRVPAALAVNGAGSSSG